MANQQQLHIRQLKTGNKQTRQIRIQHVQKVKTPKLIISCHVGGFRMEKSD